MIRAALQKALDALTTPMQAPAEKQAAIAGLRTALAQPDAEPEVDIDRSIGCRHGIAGYCTKCNASPQPAPVAQPLHVTHLVEWLSARYKAAGGKEGITDVSEWACEVMRWTEAQHGIGGKA